MEYSILVVDDQPENIRFISILLKEMELGNKIYSAPNGKVALGLIEKITPDLILSDWGMPEMDGLELLKALKASHKTKDIPFIMISAIKIDAASMKESFEAGVHDYLKKPFDKLEFVARVTATLKLQDAYLKIKKNGEEIANQALLISKQHEELQKLNMLKDRIFSIISHDVRAPLATLDGLLEIFSDEEIQLDEKELIGYVGTVKTELNSIQSLMDNLLYWAKSQLANREMSKTDVNINEVTQEISELFHDKIVKKSLDFYNHANSNTTIYGDKNVISFVIRNLFANAIKFTPIGGRITVDLKVIEDSVVISVIDTGVGMDKEVLDSIFDEDMVSTQKGTSGEVGTGLGLMLCKELIEQNKGSLSVKSEIGKGSTFSFTIPIEN
ncbi:hybrid sensor histidine kinase/response regulator [Aquimarina sp. AD10]|uniref:hybrid sensor histidine kinase/response regulator n=1 Tax=Aquimarina sp. AD10 TaxID=1714849 RepID=UPI000E4BC4FA|nr:hybrid sensor histidine kinase/response regulator [Aquimarina sp. AD10]AXT63404.1 hybrid sensor histidine kinase/response regulator [Aquimarina sp. AD10]RKN00583.1 response regulator [Aquimarina sp. AD10]